MKKWLFLPICLSLIGTLFWLSRSESSASLSETKTIESKPREKLSLRSVWGLTHPEPEVYTQSLVTLEREWDDGLTAPLLELLRFLPHQRAAELRERLPVWTGQKLQSKDEWYRWYWSLNKRPPDWYPDFKALLYRNIDPSFELYFRGRQGSDIDLTEVRWGGVRRDGIPPLDHPKMLRAEEVDYLQDSDVVFGIVHKGDARAYPKRILAWHEMFRDEIGGESIAGVYCTLCGTVIPYRSQEYVLGTSGFLYRSNKVMYDLKTRSLWSTFEGKPVFGPLRGRGIQLDTIPVVTTTWGEWKKRHPKTTVLSLDTGHKRDYGEGVAYHDYFSTDELMFQVPATDDRLLNKDEVLIPRLSGPPLALAAKFLKQNPVHHDKMGSTEFVVLTDSSGANRVYEAGTSRFLSYDGHIAQDKKGNQWTVKPDFLVNEAGEKLARLPAHRAFWFGWYSVHPETRLVKE